VEPRALTIAINDRPLRPPKTGVGHYVGELLRWLPQVAPRHHYVGFFTGVLGWRPPSIETAPRDAPPGTPTRRPPWFVRHLLQAGYQAAFRLATRRRRYNLYHEPNNIAMRWRGPTITTVHDMSVVRHPEWHPDDRVAWYQREFEKSAAQTTHFICPSAFTKRELVELAGVAPDRVTVIPLAPREPFRPQPPEKLQEVRGRMSLPDAFLLFVGTLEPRKNVDGLLEAYSRLSASVRRCFPLVLVGAAGWGVRGLWERATRLNVQETVLPLGYVTEGDLAALYTAARGLVWPSWYEGFGLPPLECMACGTPVITSNTSSLPEVVGDAGLMVDPGDSAALARTIQRIIEDEAAVADLAARGRARAAQFTWQQCAAAHVAVYERFAT
jgi:glycosyltransferase involved in cell wall biosynthesis